MSTREETVLQQVAAPLGDITPERLEELFAALEQAFERERAVVADRKAWKQLRDRWLGRRAGILTAITDHWLKPAPAELRPRIGQHLNRLRTRVEQELQGLLEQIEAEEEVRRLAAERTDLSLPGLRRPVGTRHLITQTLEEISRIFLRLGYTVATGPEIETPYYNFEALNMPEFHPARDMWDTFYIATPAGRPGSLLLRTHTSPMQVRLMERQSPPLRVIVPGKVYRRDNPDASHLFMFHQVEGLAVDYDLTFADFKGTIEFFVREFLGPRARTRLRPSYFPFTEPSAEVDASCPVCQGRGCRTCKSTGWIELMGAGMVDPAVYGFVHYDPKKVSGFAFGMGVDRLAILKYGLDDIQVLFQNDVRFLNQFP